MVSNGLKWACVWLPEMWPCTALCHVPDITFWCAAGPMEAARHHFASLGHDVPPHVNIADAVLDLVIRSPPSQARQPVPVSMQQQILLSGQHTHM